MNNNPGHGPERKNEMSEPTRSDYVTRDAIQNRLVNAAATAASNEVYDYAGKFKKREDYEPLEELANRVQRVALEAAVDVWRSDQGLPPLSAHERRRKAAKDGAGT